MIRELKMTKKEIFLEILTIMQEDSATRKDLCLK